MQIRRAIAIVGLGVAVSLPVAAAGPSVTHAATGAGAVASVLAQAEHPEAGDVPHPAGLTETETGTAATACEQPTGSPAIAAGDIGGAVGPGCAQAETPSDAPQPQPTPVGQ